jgi:hypothetical protein
VNCLFVSFQVPALVVRVLITFMLVILFVFSDVTGVVSFHVSAYFAGCNGVEQDGVLSPVLLCLYSDGLLVTLSKAGVGCFMGSHFVGALAYADDIVFLAPSASALRTMLVICDTGNCAQDLPISFNASKSKCLVAILPAHRRCLNDNVRGYILYAGDNPVEDALILLYIRNM